MPSGPTVREVAVDVVEGRVGRPKSDFGGERADLLLGEGVELLAGLPDVRDPDAAVGRGAPVEQGTGWALAAGSEVHLVDYLVVLLQRGSVEVHHYGNSHHQLPEGSTADSVSARADPSESATAPVGRHHPRGMAGRIACQTVSAPGCLAGRSGRAYDDHRQWRRSGRVVECGRGELSDARRRQR